MDKIEQLKSYIDEVERVVFFGGAGVSTESGIPDFRSADGLYTKGGKIPPETILSSEFFYSHTAEFYDFYKKSMIFENAKPNAAHIFLAELEEKGKLDSVITQNIDGLHQKAGSKKVYELHGSVHRNRCVSCGTFYGLDYIMNSKGVPHCEKCGGIIKPEVVLYGESLDDETVRCALRSLSRSDLLIIGGTSLVVYPAAGFIGYFGGKRKVIINMSPTSGDRECDLVISEPIGKVFGALQSIK